MNLHMPFSKVPLIWSTISLHSSSESIFVLPFACGYCVFFLFWHKIQQIFQNNNNNTGFVVQQLSVQVEQECALCMHVDHKESKRIMLYRIAVWCIKLMIMFLCWNQMNSLMKLLKGSWFWREDSRFFCSWWSFSKMCWCLLVLLEWTLWSAGISVSEKHDNCLASWEEVFLVIMQVWGFLFHQCSFSCNLLGCWSWVSRSLPANWD